MQTNANIDNMKKHLEAGKKLLKAAYEFWELHQKTFGPNAVVWLEDDGDTQHFVMFTRSEYKDAILEAAKIETKNERRLCDPFTAQSK